MEKNLIPRSQSSAGFFGIFKKSFETISRNKKLLLLILLLVYFSYSELEISEKYLRVRFIEDYVLQLSRNQIMFQFGNTLDLLTYRGFFDNILETLLYKHFSVPLFTIIHLYFLVAVVSTSSEAYNDKVLGLKVLFLKLKISWKKALYTGLCLFLISLGIFCFYMASFGITNMLVFYSWSFLLSTFISLSIPVCYCYVAVLWMLSTVVSVLEEGTCGFKAIGRALELMNGKTLQASLMMVPFVIVRYFVYDMVNLITSYYISRSTRWYLKISFTNGSFCLLKLLMFVAYTVFYHERKKCINEWEVKGVYLHQGNYLPISTSKAS